jgi:hypothetical protein
MDTDHNTFTVVFDRVYQDAAQLGLAESVGGSEAARDEIDEIAELRRLVLEITDPDPVSYTTA